MNPRLARFLGRGMFAAIVAAAAPVGGWHTFAAARARSPLGSAELAQPPSRPAGGVHRFGLERPLPRKPGAIRLATYNTLNLFDHVDDPELQGEFDDLPNATPVARCRKLAEAIIAIDADIVALQEVESLEALTWFRDTFLRDAGYRYLASEDVGYYRGVECSLMSRFPIVETRIWPNESLDAVRREGPGWTAVPANERNITFQRSPLMARIAVAPGYELTVLSLHHKAGANFSWHREAEALRITELLEQMQREDPLRNIVVMGDFNAAPWDKSLRVYLKAGMVDTLAYRLIDRNSPESPLFKTHESDKVLDYILMNSAAFREYVPGSGFVFGTLCPPPSYDYRTDPHPDGYASDHYPVVVDLLPQDR